MRTASPVIAQLAVHGRLIGLAVAKTIPGFKGEGYVTGFTRPGYRLILTFHIPVVGAHGPKPFKKLRRMMYDRLTCHFHLHYLI